MMYSIQEKSLLKLRNKTPTKLASMKNPLGLFKRGKAMVHKDLATSNIKVEESHMKLPHTRNPSMSDADEESLLVDKYGFVFERDTESSTMSSVTVEEDKVGSASERDLTPSSYTPSAIQDTALDVGNGQPRGWAAMVGLDEIMHKNEGVYNDLVALSQADPDDNQDFLLGDVFKTEWEDIERDLKRTFPSHCMFREDREKGETSSETDGKQALRRILRAYSMYDREIGYCQGMNFIAGTLLMFLTEIEAFWLFVTVMNEEPYNLREVFSRDMAGTHETLYIADKLVNCFLPELYQHLEDEQVNTSMFTTQWLMTIYTSTFPLELVAIVWDSFLVEGWKIIYKTLIALLKHAQYDRDLLNCNMEQILTHLRNFQSKVDAQQITSVANTIPLKQRHIQRYALEFRKFKERGEIEVHEVFHRSNSNNSSSASPISMNLPNIGKAYRFIMKLKHAERDICVQDMSPKLVPVVGSGKFVVLLRDALSLEECGSLLKRVKGEQFQDVLIRQQRNDAAADFIKFKRASLDDQDLAAVLFDRIVIALRAKPDLWKKFSGASWMDETVESPFGVARLNHRFQCLKFGVGDFTPPHSDSRYSSGDEKSHVTMHVYLNDNFEGGITGDFVL
ncbi:hypothetical protein HJC23_008229 [Cyclotella cryptica]|uniref:Rab-GAP TBC domain-containing protein n=1 Tax=Cyclotella cryptica TaxID=29204 RepID=A0ABD3Q6U0_9STRA|eukprot:CCRYP_008360-RA/>CCRYP_008360-RA protein AED:0.13 eAED:-0.08 QI:44/1/0.33/1/1/1/3/0/620